jgi:hypothetical protein
MPVPAKPITLNGTLFESRASAERHHGFSAGLLTKKLRMKKLPVTISVKGKKYEVSRP